MNVLRYFFLPPLLFINIPSAQRHSCYYSQLRMSTILFLFLQRRGSWQSVPTPAIRHESSAQSGSVNSGSSGIASSLWFHLVARRGAEIFWTSKRRRFTHSQKRLRQIRHVSLISPWVTQRFNEMTVLIIETEWYLVIWQCFACTWIDAAALFFPGILE